MFIPTLSGSPRRFSIRRVLQPAAWYAARLEVPITDGTAILPTDFSGNGRNQTQGNAALRPLYKVNIQNGQPVFRYDGSDDVTQALFTFNPPYTKFIVAKLRAISSGANMYFLDGGNAAQGAIFAAINTSDVVAYNGVSLSVGNIGTTNFSRIAAVFNGASSSTYLNSGSATNGDAGAVATGGGVTLGANGLMSGQWAAVDIAEAILVPGIVSALNIAKTLAYLKAIYGL